MRNKSKWALPAAWLLAALLVGCKSGSEQTRTEAGAKESEKPAKQETPRQETVVIPKGTALDIRLSDGISTARTHAGARFEGTLARPLVVDGVDVAPVGSIVNGKVTRVVSSGRLKRPAELAMVLTSLTPRGGVETRIATRTFSMKRKSHKTRNIEMIGGGAGAGALIGALTGGKKGAAIGSAIGAGGGTGLAAATGKKEIILPPESRLTFVLSAAVSLPAPRS